MRKGINQDRKETSDIENKHMRENSNKSKSYLLEKTD